MLAIKLKRVGKKHQASFRVVVAEKRSKVHGNFVEDLGWMNPRTDEAQVNGERASYWMKVGAQPTPTVWNLLVRKGVVRGKKIAVHGKLRRAEAVGAPTSDATVGTGGASESNQAAVPAGEATVSAPQPDTLSTSAEASSSEVPPAV